MSSSGLLLKVAMGETEQSEREKVIKFEWKKKTLQMLIYVDPNMLSVVE